MKILIGSLITLIALLSGYSNAKDTSTIEEIRSRGHINCGVTVVNIPGFFELNNGKHTGLDADFCRAFAAAIFGDINSVKFVPLSSKDRFKSLTSQKIDVLTRLAAGRRNRDLNLDIETPVYYFIDGTGVMVHEDSKVRNIMELGDSLICEQKDNKNFDYLKGILSSNNINYKSKIFAQSSKMKDAFINKKCDVLITDRSLLADIRMNNEKIKNARILDDLVRIEALGPVVAYGDDTWRNIIKWVVLTTFSAEELNINSNNIDSRLKKGDLPTKDLIHGLKPYKKIGLDKNWAYNIIKYVGNYAEIYDRNFGPETKLNLNRSVNNLWNNGGLLYAPRVD